MKAILTRLDKRKAVELQFDPFIYHSPFLFRLLGSGSGIAISLNKQRVGWMPLDQMRLLMERRRIPKKTYKWAVAVAVEEML